MPTPAWRGSSTASAPICPMSSIILEGTQRSATAARVPLRWPKPRVASASSPSDARNRGARVFICALTPTKPGRRNIPLSTIFAINERLRVVARGEGAYFIDTFTPLLSDLDSNIDSDGLHLTTAGYKRVGEVVFAAIKADLEIP